eukprot:NODE_366_length_10082_cov_0.124211.p9 type:complete len:105 gc:universal NODE_366_length_10082_cov_0.124211:8092-7778(-)
MTSPDFYNTIITRYSSSLQMVNGINRCNPEYVKSKEVTNICSIDSSTLRNWSKHGRIRCLSTPGKRYLHNLFKERLSSTVTKEERRWLNVMKHLLVRHGQGVVL